MFVAIDAEIWSVGKGCYQLGESGFAAASLPYQQNWLTIVYGLDGESSHSFETIVHLDVYTGLGYPLL
jgi:hypothetical protein